MARRRSWSRRAACLVALALAACARREAAPQPSAARAGRAAPRVVVMAPGAAETLAALGLADCVVGVGDYVNWPPVLASRPRVGPYDRPNLEQVLALHADLFVTTQSQADQPALDSLRRLGVRTLALDTATVAGTLSAIERLGGELDRTAPARALVAGIRMRLDAVRRRAAGAPPRRVLCVVGRDPLYVAGPGSFLDQLIVLAGGTNVAADVGAPFATLSLEAALERLPEVILDTSDNHPGSPRGRSAGAWAQWPLLPAVAAQQVYRVDPERIAIPGPRLGDMAELVAKLVHPEIFGPASDAELGPLQRPRATR